MHFVYIDFEYEKKKKKKLVQFCPPCFPSSNPVNPIIITPEIYFQNQAKGENNFENLGAFLVV